MCVPRWKRMWMVNSIHFVSPAQDWLSKILDALLLLLFLYIFPSSHEKESLKRDTEIGRRETKAWNEGMRKRREVPAELRLAVGLLEELPGSAGCLLQAVGSFWGSPWGRRWPGMYLTYMQVLPVFCVSDDVQVTWLWERSQQRNVQRTEWRWQGRGVALLPLFHRANRLAAAVAAFPASHTSCPGHCTASMFPRGCIERCLTDKRVLKLYKSALSSKQLVI